MKKIQNTDPRVKEAIVLYKAGNAVRTICKQLKMDTMTVRRFLLEEGILRTRAEAIRTAKSDATIFDEALDVLTPEALYWIGFLYADGHIESDRPRILMTLSEVDKGHLQKFADFFGNGLVLMQVEDGVTPKKNGYTSQKAYRVGFSSKNIHEKLLTLGFSSRKTWDITPHELLKNSRDFWRGVVDGDGWIYKTNLSSIGLSGHENTIKEFLLYLKRLGLTVEATAKQDSRREHLWTTNIRAKHLVHKTITALYKDSTVYLDRKYQKYLEIINQQ